MKTESAIFYIKYYARKHKAIIERNFDQPEKIYKLLDSQKDYKNKLSIICNSPEMLKA